MICRPKTAADWIRDLELKAHPEGGYFRETYRSTGLLPAELLATGLSGVRNFSTAIYYLLEAGDFSAFHRIRSDELWHFYAGDSLLIEVLERGEHRTLRLGQELENGASLQHIVPAGAWFAATPEPGSSYVLAGCTVSPGFDFRDFQMASARELIAEHPQYIDVINRMTRP